MMSSFELVLHLVMALLSISNASDSHESRPKRQVPKTTISVDQSGSGNYTSVQEAINSVPDNNDEWIRILIKQGTYIEKVKIPSTKQYIFLQGDSRYTTTIQYGDSGDVINAATFQLYADNFVASDITFKNSYNIQIADTNGTRVTWAPAALITGDKVSFHRCGFRGIQDTLGDSQGRHYFQNCYISGVIDFIWGRGQSVYKNCLVETVASSIDRDGYITAQGRESADDPTAFVFIKGQVTGEGHTYLGRAWRQYSRVIFYETDMSDVVKPEGWDSWNFQGHEDDITYAEVGCTGAGANQSGRVQWMKNLPSKEVDYFISKDFISKDGWLKKQP
ncbi:hypothetical protein NL676_030494 [Syzygium grande]|nr:hypothetical protein NL676_030494 [Syzygium grande]